MLRRTDADRRQATAFTDSDPWRVLRIMGEYVHGFDALAEVGAAVCLFGSARTPESDPMYQAARDLAQRLCKAGFAVITGGGTGMGRELARHLAAEGCHIAICDVSEESLAQTKAICQRVSPRGTRVSTTLADVSDEPAVLAFRDAVARDHRTDHIHLLFNNAGIGAAGSFIRDERGDWEKTVAGLGW